jgi:hypothetical protein
MPEIRFNCDWYNPCPICSKCRNLADSKYTRCQQCGFSANRCKHTDDQIALMIKRDNFKLNLTDEAKLQLRELVNAQK